MAYGRIYIENLRKKVNRIFSDLQDKGVLNKENFKQCFKTYFPKDYSLLEYEYEFKLSEFKKNRRGQPKHQPLKPDTILENMYKNYYFKIVTYPLMKHEKEVKLGLVKCDAGRLGYKIRSSDKKMFDVIKKASNEIVASGITFKELLHMFPLDENRIQKRLNK